MRTETLVEIFDFLRHFVAQRRGFLLGSPGKSTFEFRLQTLGRERSERD
jgi:hypothetical protein